MPRGPLSREERQYNFPIGLGCDQFQTLDSAGDSSPQLCRTPWRLEHVPPIMAARQRRCRTTAECTTMFMGEC